MFRARRWGLLKYMNSLFILSYHAWLSTYILLPVGHLRHATNHYRQHSSAQDPSSTTSKHNAEVYNETMYTGMLPLKKSALNLGPRMRFFVPPRTALSAAAYATPWKCQRVDGDGIPTTTARRSPDIRHQKRSTESSDVPHRALES